MEHHIDILPHWYNLLCFWIAVVLALCITVRSSAASSSFTVGYCGGLYISVTEL